MKIGDLFSWGFDDGVEYIEEQFSKLNVTVHVYRHPIQHFVFTVSQWMEDVGKARIAMEQKSVFDLNEEIESKEGLIGLIVDRFDGEWTYYGVENAR